MSKTTKPIFIQHRVNTLAQLATLNPEYGAEIDVRVSSAGRHKLQVVHDPWVEGEDFDRWLENYAAMNPQGPLIINTKDDGLEEVILQKCRAKNLSSFFFLDTTMPTLVNWLKAGQAEFFSCRFSQYEPLETIHSLPFPPRWIWADCFNGRPPSIESLKILKNNYKICLVSPELHGLSSSLVVEFLPLLEYVEAICTKNPDIWLSLMDGQPPSRKA